VVLRLVLDQYEFARYDFGRNINFKLYQEDGSTPFDASGYTGVVKAFKRQGDRAFFFRDVAKAMSVMGSIAQIISDITVTWDTQTDGVGHWAWTSTLRPSVPGMLWIEIQLTKSGEQTSSELLRTFVHPSEAA
jgi:hypothetical protein